MKTTKTTTTAYELEGGQLVIGAMYLTFFVKTTDGIMEYEDSEMIECYELTQVQLNNMRQQLNR